MEDIVLVIPHVEDDPPELSGQANGPSMSCLPTSIRYIILLLDLRPVIGQHAFQEIGDTNMRLSIEAPLYVFWIPSRHICMEIISFLKGAKDIQNGFFESRICLLFCHPFLKGFASLFPSYL